MGESARCGDSRWVRLLAAVALAVAMVGGATRPGHATIKYGAMQVSGSFEAQNLARDPSPTEFHFIQQRNTFRLRIDWDWVQNGNFLDKVNVPFAESSKLFMLYRGVYDSFYDIAPTENQIGQTIFDDKVGGPIDGTGSRFNNSTRSADKFENQLREFYIDTKLKDLPVSLRTGRQQVIWGESDQFRLMDIWNPLDTTWHFQQESWDNIRIATWLAKALWDVGDVGPFSNTFVEVVYNPFDFQPGAKVDFLPRPWALPFPDPLRGGQVQYDPRINRYVSPTFNLEGTSLRKGAFQRNPADASEIGTRVHAVTPQGLEFSLNYLYGRGRGVGAASPFAVKIHSITTNGHGQSALGMPIEDAKFLGKSVYPVAVDAEVIHPYMHIFGLTGNYFEGDFTQAVFRFESAYVMGEPFQTTDPSKRVTVTNEDGVSSGTLAPIGFEQRDVWAGMIGFDRPTWIRWLNSKATWFLTGQAFWNYTTGANVDQLVGNNSAGDSPYFTPKAGQPGSNTQGLGVWQGGQFNGFTERLQDASVAGNGDNIRRWESLITIAGTSFYRGGTIVPFIADAFDPVNMNDEFLYNLDWFATNDLIFSLQQKFFTAFGRTVPSNDPWFAGGRFTRRDETGVKVTYQF
ncbi:MAG: hypothetical protein HYR72_18150 [Deltaproteobacteria bacterium]|nr:hypothetical protein [Deltaproteobacteria bacterium]MBI3386357.1 hypothetical protein [Deltaproteobacteria bacterium]